MDHTELEYLAVLTLWQCRRRDRRPKLIAENVWLFDKWQRFSAPKRCLYRRLISQADVLTSLSPENLKIRRELFPQSRSEFIRFGINSDTMVSPVQHAAHHPVHIAALGNDMHHDWETLIAVAEKWSGCRLRIGSKSINHRLTDYAHNIEVITPSSDREVAELYSWADIVVVPLKPNLHASGITVIYEAVLRGVPVVCTDTGGLTAYFSPQEVRYVPAQDPVALRRALEELAEDDQKRFAMAKRAQARMLSSDLSSRSFARRHYEISRELVDDALVRLTKARACGATLIDLATQSQTRPQRNQTPGSELGTPQPARQPRRQGSVSSRQPRMRSGLHSRARHRRLWPHRRLDDARVHLKSCRSRPQPHDYPRNGGLLDPRRRRPGRPRPRSYSRSRLLDDRSRHRRGHHLMRFADLRSLAAQQSTSPETLTQRHRSDRHSHPVPMARNLLYRRLERPRAAGSAFQHRYRVCLRAQPGLRVHPALRLADHFRLLRLSDRNQSRSDDCAHNPAVAMSSARTGTAFPAGADPPHLAFRRRDQRYHFGLAARLRTRQGRRQRDAPARILRVLYAGVAYCRLPGCCLFAALHRVFPGLLPAGGCWQRAQTRRPLPSRLSANVRTGSADRADRDFFRQASDLRLDRQGVGRRPYRAHRRAAHRRFGFYVHSRHSVRSATRLRLDPPRLLVRPVFAVREHPASLDNYQTLWRCRRCRRLADGRPQLYRDRRDTVHRRLPYVRGNRWFCEDVAFR